MAWILLLCGFGEVSCQDSTESMPVGRIRAFRSKQCLFWVNFRYVVPMIKYASKLVELISNNGYGLAFIKSGGALAAKIIDIDRQQPYSLTILRLVVTESLPCTERVESYYILSSLSLNKLRGLLEI